MPLPTINVQDASGATVSLRVPNDGRRPAGDAQAVVFSNEDFAAVTGPLSASRARLVGNNRSRLRDDFGGTVLDATRWETVATGAGMTVSLPGVTTSYLIIASGTTANAETIIRSVEVFQLPLRLALGISASQRIANCEAFVELIEVTEAGVPVAGSAQTNAGTARNYAGLKFDGTTPTTALVVARGGGAPETVSAASTIVTTVATGTGPNFVPANSLELQVSGEHALLLSSAIDTLNAATAARRITQSAPDPNGYYKVQIRVRNLAVAPASSTDWRIHFLRLFDYTRLTTEVVSGVGSNSAANAPSVNVAGGSLVLGAGSAGIGSVILGTGTANVGAVSLQPNTMVADVASAAITTNSTTATITPAFGPSYEVNIVVTAVSGTAPTLDVVVQESDDGGTNWFDVWHFPRITAAGAYRSPPIAQVGNRVRYVQTVGGTSPSFTRAINRNQINAQASVMRQMIDRTAATFTTLNAASTVMTLSGARNIEVQLAVATAGTPPAVQLQGSDDNGVSWYDIGTPLTATAGATVRQIVSNISPQLVRTRTSTAGVTVTGGAIALKAF